MTTRPPKTTDWQASQYTPAPSTPVLNCQALIRHLDGPWFRCGAVYLDDQPGRHAHETVFGHPPVRDPQ